MSTSVRRAIEAPDIKAKLEKMVTPYRPLFNEDFARFIDAEQKLWWPIVREAVAN